MDWWANLTLSFGWLAGGHGLYIVHKYPVFHHYSLNETMRIYLFQPCWTLHWVTSSLDWPTLPLLWSVHSEVRTNSVGNILKWLISHKDVWLTVSPMSPQRISSSSSSRQLERMPLESWTLRRSKSSWRRTHKVIVDLIVDLSNLNSSLVGRSYNNCEWGLLWMHHDVIRKNRSPETGLDMK